ncbi:MAG TPA: hypothetical protein VF691_04235 [Cytophagaceae bacterium]|jgi:hypothetical protein
MGKNIFDKAGDLIQKSIGEDGLKTDVRITLTDQSYYKIGLAIFIPGLVLIVMFFAIRGISKA